MPSQTLLPSSKPTNAAVNLLHLNLFHHFQTCTRQTLCVPGIWGDTLQLCFQFEYLMDAVLCVAARHLAILLPEDTTYPTAAANHLSRALSRFRHILSNNIGFAHVDAFIATSFLLQFEMWTSTDFSSPRDDGVASFDPSREGVFAFSSSLKKVFLNSAPLAAHQPSVILPHLQTDPGAELVKLAQISDDKLNQYHNFLSYQRPLNLGLLDIPFLYTQCTDLYCDPEAPGTPDPLEDAYALAVARLCLILSFLPEARPPNSVSAGPLWPQLARYIFTFPTMCHGLFASMVQKSDPRALLLLYHFYRAVRILLPLGECWWAHKRASVAETVLKEWLTRECAKRANAPDTTFRGVEIHV
jgi:hypothetical protein